MKKFWRCGLPSIEEYVEDIFINRLLDGNEEQSEGHKSIFVRKSIYSTLLKSSQLPLEDLHSRDVRVEERHERERWEQERWEQEERERKEKDDQQQIR